MSQDKKGFIKTVVADFVDLYSTHSPIPQGKQRDLAFFSSAKEVLRRHLHVDNIQNRNVTQVDSTEIHSVTISHQGLKIGNKKSKSFRLLLTSYNCRSFMLLFDELCKSTASDPFKPAILKETFKKSTYSHELSMHLEDELYHLVDFSLDDLSSFDVELVSLVQNPDEENLIPSFFNLQWESFPELVQSLLITYLSYYDTLEKIRTCRQCEKLFYPAKSGPERGFFCSEGCKTQFYNINNKDIRNCQAKQRQFINTRLDRIRKNGHDRNGHRIDIEELDKKVEDIFPTARTCRKCSLARGGVFAKGGECPTIQRHECYEDIIENYKFLRMKTRKL